MISHRLDVTEIWSQSFVLHKDLFFLHRVWIFTEIPISRRFGFDRIWFSLTFRLADASWTGIWIWILIAQGFGCSQGVFSQSLDFICGSDFRFRMDSVS